MSSTTPPPRERLPAALENSLLDYEPVSRGGYSPGRTAGPALVRERSRTLAPCPGHAWPSCAVSPNVVDVSWVLTYLICDDKP
jgi:hypothetical protein